MKNQIKSVKLNLSRSHFFRCPVCKFTLRPQNTKCIVCWNCGHGGTLERFSSVERMAA